MTITEARDIDEVITALLALRDNPRMSITYDSLCSKLIWLADRAHKATGAGISGDTVRRRWPKPDGWTGK